MKYPLRTEIEVLPDDKPRMGFRSAIVIDNRGKMVKNSFKLGWTVREIIGYTVVNTRGVSKGSKSIKELE